MKSPTASISLARLSSGKSTRSLGKIASLVVAAALSAGAASHAALDSIIVGPDETYTVSAPGGASGLVIDTTVLTIAPTGVLNIQDNALIIRLETFEKIFGYLANGYNGGAWDGVGGINSSTAASDPNLEYGVGIIDNSEANLTFFEGHALSTNAEILVKYALYGDANLDGYVNQLDADLFGTGNGLGWYHGDFDYSGTVDEVDFAILTNALPAAIPEPAACSLLIAGAMLVSTRRRR